MVIHFPFLPIHIPANTPANSLISNYVVPANNDLIAS